MSDDKKKEPIARLHEGAVRAKICENQTDKGVRHNVTFSRAYQDKDGNWQETQSFGDRDLLSMQLAAGRAHDAIRERQTELRQQERPKEGTRPERVRNGDRER